MCSPYQESNTQFYFILHGKKKNPKYKGPQLTLEQHKLELRGSTYTWIFFNKYTVGLPYSHIRDLRIQSTVGISFHIWLNSQMWKYRCSGLTTGLKDPWIWVHLGGTRGFPGSSEGAESACNAGDLGLVPESGRSSGEGNSNLLQYSCLENPMDRGAWWATVHGVVKSWTRLSD